MLLSSISPRPVRRQLRRQIELSGRERALDADELIVSKTDIKGRIVYANRTMIEISGFAEHELIGAPHSILRHPDMPRAVFQFMWERIAAGHEIFAYVVNMCRNGDHYWVQAHVTPSFGADGSIIGYHSNRRAPSPVAVEAASSLYRDLCLIEAQAKDRRAGLAASRSALESTLEQIGKSYDAFVTDL